MRPAVTTVETRGHLAAAAYLMNHAGQSALVVVDPAGWPVAVITESDLLRAVAHGEDAEQAVIDDWMSRDPLTVGPDVTVVEAVQLMMSTAHRHLPVVSDGRLMGIVAITDIVQALVHSVRLASALVFVSDLSRSLGFYQPLLRYVVTIDDPDAALLVGPDGSQLYLYQTDDRRGGRHGAGVGVQVVAWTAGGPDDLDRCTELLKDRNAFERRHTVDGIGVLEGRDPDGLPVVISYPGPDTAPRRVIDQHLVRVE